MTTETTPSRADVLGAAYDKLAAESTTTADPEPPVTSTTPPPATATEPTKTEDRARDEKGRFAPGGKPADAPAGAQKAGDATATMGLSIPLPIIDRSKGKKQEAQANVHIAQAAQVAVEQRLLREWGTASKRFRTAAEQVTNYRERILPKANEALRLVQTGFEQGKFSFIDLLDTQRTTAEVRLAYQQKLLELNVARAELESLAAGGLQLTQPNKSQP